MRTQGGGLKAMNDIVTVILVANSIWVFTLKSGVIEVQTHSCYPMHMLRSSGYTLPGKYNDDLSLSPRTKMPKNAYILHTNPWDRLMHTLTKKLFLQPFFKVIHQTISNSGNYPSP